jgi:hypothetical protein
MKPSALLRSGGNIKKGIGRKETQGVFFFFSWEENLLSERRADIIG